MLTYGLEERDCPALPFVLTVKRAGQVIATHHLPTAAAVEKVKAQYRAADAQRFRS